MNIQLYTNEDIRENVLKSYRGFSLKNANDILNESNEELTPQELADLNLSKCIKVKDEMKGGIKE